MHKKKKATMKEIIETARRIVMDKLEVDEGQVTLEASFIRDLGADSLDHVELMMEFEKEFDIAIHDEEWERVDTFNDAVTLIGSKQ